MDTLTRPRMFRQYTPIHKLIANHEHVEKHCDLMGNVLIAHCETTDFWRAKLIATPRVSLCELELQVADRSKCHSRGVCEHPKLCGTPGCRESTTPL